jgi:hypothetical protein
VSGAEEGGGADLSALVVGKDVMGRMVAPLGALFAVMGVPGSPINVGSPIGMEMGVSVVVDGSSPSHSPSTRTMSFARLTLIIRELRRMVQYCHWNRLLDELPGTQQAASCPMDHPLVAS